MELLFDHLPLVFAIGATGFVAFLLLVRRLSAAEREQYDWARIQSFSPTLYQPLERLLLEEDYIFLRSQRGYQPVIETNLRRHRREIFGDYVDRLAADFRALHKIARVMVLNHQHDSPELVAALVRQSATFRYALLKVRVRLALHTAGIQPAALKPADVRPLLDAARWMSDQVRAMSPQMSAASA